MNSKQLILIILFFSWSSVSNIHAQEATFIGSVIDSETLLAIPYSTIEIVNKQQGTVCDGQGVFNLIFSGEELSPNDSFLVKSLGYRDTVISIADFRDQAVSTITLKRDIFELGEVVIKPGQKTFRTGVTREQDASHYMSNWVQLAVFMENSEQVNGLLKSARFCIGNSPKPKAPFRVRVYDVSPSGAPGKDLTHEIIIISGKKRNSWISVDLRNYNIVVPKNGFFVAMEWIFTSKKYFYRKIPGSKRSPFNARYYGQAIGNTIKSDKPLTWFSHLGKKWTNNKDFFPGRKTFYNVLISAEIQVLD